MKAIWKGALSFGLVTIPVRVFKATEEKGLSFNQLHKTDQGRIKYKRICSVDGAEVPWGEIARGYEYEKDHYVVLSDEDLDRGIPSARLIEILKFVPLDDIDPIYWRDSYYLAPDGPGLKAYRLLSRALTDDRRVALCKLAFRDKEHLATLRVREGVFVLSTMLWPDEIRAAEFAELSGEVEIRPQELKMAKSLIDNMTGEFDLDEVHDTYRERLEDLVARKIEGREVAVVAEAGTAKVVDLIDALKASVEKFASGGPARKRAPVARKKKAAGE